MKTIKFGFFMFFWLSITSLCLANEEMLCPAKVHLVSGNVLSDDIPPDYKSFVSDTTVRLTGITVFDGPPEDGAALKPLSSSQNGEHIKWVFEGEYEKGKWFSCDYANGIIRLIRKIREPSSSCMATVVKTKPYNVLEARLICE